MFAGGRQRYQRRFDLMLADIRDIDEQALRLQLHSGAVRRDSAERAEDQAVEGVVL